MKTDNRADTTTQKCSQSSTKAIREERTKEQRRTHHHHEPKKQSDRRSTATHKRKLEDFGYIQQWMDTAVKRTEDKEKIPEQN